MPPTKLSVLEIKAVAETAITARHAADAAKTAFDAKPDDASLKTTWEAAEQTATEAKSKADALSQQTLSPEQIAKKKRKIAIIQSELQAAGISDDTDDDTDLEDDDDKPITRGDLKRIAIENASQTASQMADAVQDPAAKQAIKDALVRLVPSGDALKDFADAVAIANRGKNSKVLEEIGRTPPRIAHHTSAGGPPRKLDGEFVPTSEEARYMRPPFSLTKDQIIKARPQQS